MNNVIGQIERAIDMTGVIVGSITVDQWQRRTPCDGWDVHTTLNHVVGGMHIFAAELNGTDPGGKHEDDWLGTDPAAAYRTAAAIDQAAWRRPDVLNSTVQISLGALPGRMAAVIHLTELTVHGADLATGTDQEHLVDQELCAELLVTMQAMGMDAYRVPGMFGPELTAPHDAPTHRRLLAYLGRDLQHVSPAG
jgi:uncharacterized protein (TIGR03086 family)